ncbi:MAG TPA: IS4 family transposase [Candidatus Acidoferrales bacterium]|nr:IS4 family transposase [Candidatus Acidoferrales bacterium]
MYAGKLIFAQVTDLVHPEQFRRCVRRYNGEHKVKTFSCWNQFLCMAFGQLTFRESLRDVATCLRSRPDQLYHLGIRGEVSHSTLADANRERDWRIYYDLAQLLIRRARLLYENEPTGLDLKQTAYALDSTTIDLCLNLFPWARFRRTKGAVKLHTLLDLRGSIPAFISISHGKKADVKILDELILEPGSFYVMDRGYVDFRRLYCFVLAAAFFVTRSKSGLQFNRLESRPVDFSTGVRSDQIVWLRNLSSIEHYPDKLRRIHYVDPESSKSLVFLTNNLELPARTIALLYKSRWKVELFFKWIKQHLCIKHFYGTSDNAVKTQIWISVCVYVLVAIIKKQLQSQRSLYSILQVLSVNAFSKEPLDQVLKESGPQDSDEDIRNQLIFNY